jgi:acetylornithine/succinyldiaminopimelate/putrescine aminotransferase
VTGAHLAAELGALPGVQEVRGGGLFLGAVLDRPAGPVASACLDAGLVVITAGEHVLRLAPPLIASTADVDSAVEILTEALQ